MVRVEIKLEGAFKLKLKITWYEDDHNHRTLESGGESFLLSLIMIRI